MRRFPRREADIVALANSIISGLTEQADDFSSPPLGPSELQNLVDSYHKRQDETAEARSALTEAVKAKHESLAALVSGMKKVLRYAEDAVDHHDIKLKALGWRTRREATPLQPPGQVGVLEVKEEGRGWVSLAWEKPSDGGKVAVYLVQSRRGGDSDWSDAAVAFETNVELSGQDRGVQMFYRVVAANKAGEGLYSNEIDAWL